MVMARNMRKKFIRPFAEDEKEVNKVGRYQHSRRYGNVHHIKRLRSERRQRDP